jgi:GTP-binding protein
VAIVGRPNAGKSSLLNALAGEKRVIVSEAPGTTRDAIDTTVKAPQGLFRFVDTAGMRKAAKVSGVEYYSYLRSLDSLERAHVAIVVLDTTVGMGELDVNVGTEAARRGCATVLAANKSDLVPPDLDELRAIARRKLRQQPPVIAVSAFIGAGLGELLDVVALLPFGYPTTQRRAGRKNRRPISEIASRGRYGQPFS